MNFIAAFFIGMSGTVNTGVMTGHHLISNNLNNTHPYIQYEEDNYGFSLFYNSFERVSFSSYFKQEFTDGSLSFSMRYGLSTGYNEYNIYKDRVYKLENIFMVTDGLMVTVVPEVKYKFDSDYYVNSMILGDSISVGLGYSF